MCPPPLHAACAAGTLDPSSLTPPPLCHRCGDFNFKPGDAPYRLITEGNLPTTDEAYPTARAHDAWTPTSPISLQSAYKQLQVTPAPATTWVREKVNVIIAEKATSTRHAQGEEPAYTNWAHTRNSQPFVGTLDYIFVSKGCQTVDVLPMPNALPADLDKGNGEGIYGGPFPTVDEPSDHLMVAATIELP